MRLPSLFCRAVAGVVLLFAGSHLVETQTPAAHAQVTTNTALQIGKGQGVVRVQGRFQQANAPGQRLYVTAFPVVGAYGITPNFTVFGIFPVVNKRLRVDTPGGTRTRGTRGLADVRAFARYTVWRRDGAGTMLRLAPFAGVEAPTGRSTQTDDLGRLPRPLQLGSSSLDPFGGLIFTWHQLNWQFDATASYEHNTTADNFQFGDIARVDAVVKRRLLPADLGGATWFLFGNLETSLIHQERHEQDGATVADSGGTTWFVTPAVQYVTRRFVVDAAVQIPAVQDMNGDALEDDFIITLSTRINF